MPSSTSATRASRRPRSGLHVPRPWLRARAPARPARVGRPLCRQVRRRLGRDAAMRAEFLALPPGSWCHRPRRLVRAMGPVARAELLPHFVPPMLLETGRPAAPADGLWAVEVKFDGIRPDARRRPPRWCVRSRPGRNCTAEFPELAALAQALGEHDVVLDGELVHFGADGRPDFSALRRRLTSTRRYPRNP
jgi:ATP-dependent DNA ligase